MVSRVVVPLDGSDLAEQVLPYARTMARALRVPIVLLRTFTIGYPPSSSTVTPTYLGNLSKALTTEAEGYLATLSAKLRAEGLTVHTAVAEGAPNDRIVELGEADPGTLIAMATHGRSGVSRFVLGSVASKVLHTTARPLLIVRPKTEKGDGKPVAFSRVIVPVDGSPLAEQAIAQAAELAVALSLPVVLMRVTPAAADYYKFAGFASEGFDDLIKQVDAEANTYLRALAERLRSQHKVTVQVMVVQGDAATVIIEQAQSVPGSLIIMTTHGRSGLGRWVLGSVADRVISHAGTPVLVVRPKA